MSPAPGRRIALLAALATIASRPVAAEVWDFLPRSTWNELLLDLSAFREEDELRGAAGRERWEDTFTKERLVLSSLGYFYHPRFLQYDVSLGIALKQELYESTLFDPPGRRSDGGWDHDVKLVGLPEHPYNVTLFSRRYEPVYREQAAVARDSVESNHGAIFRYRQRPYFLEASYLDSVLETSLSSSEVEKLSANAEYFRQLEEDRKLSFFAGADRSRFSGGSDLSGLLTDFHLGNLVDLPRLRLSSDLSGTQFEQGGASSGSIDSSNVALQERLDLVLPWRLEGDATYRQRRSESTFASPGSPERTLSDRSSELELRVSHRLYESLESEYTFLGATHASSGGRSTSLSHGLAVDYSKSIPHGMVLAGLGAGTGETDAAGTGTDVIDESHAGIAVPTQSFELVQRDVEERSIALFLKSPLPPNEAILLARGVHYVVRSLPDRSSFELQVVVLPPGFAVPGSYDFLVSYSTTGGDFATRTTSGSGNVRVELLDNLLTPYASYVAISSEVVSGTLPGTPVDSTTAAAGIRVRWGIASGVVEYRDVRLEVSPYTAWRAEAQVSGNVADGTTLHASASREERRHDEGSALLLASPYTERRDAATASVQQQLFGRSLTLSLGGTWAQVRGPYESEATSASASLAWRVGRLDVSAGASIYRASTSGIESLDTERDHSSLYLRIRRVIF